MSLTANTLGYLSERAARKLCDRCGQELSKAPRRENKSGMNLCRDCTPYRRDYH